MQTPSASPARARRRRSEDGRPQRDAGLGLIEIVVAMVVFGIVATGIIGAVTITLKMTPDNQDREVAANLAAQEIDLVRAVGDPYRVGAKTTTQVIDGVTYTIDRTTGWLQPNGITGTCGASNANYELKVNVAVSWTGQTSTTKNVRSDTVLAPLSTLTTSSTGAMAIYVYDSTNQPQPGASLTVTAAGNGAVTPTTQPGATGSDGCSYLGRLAPGNYTVSAKLTGSSSTASKAVAAGSTTPVSLTLNGYGTLVPSLADNQTADVLRPTNLSVSYVTGTTIASVSSATSVTAQSNITSGYTAVAGKLGTAGGTGATAVKCGEFDPAQWSAGTVNGTQLANGQRETAKPLKPGQTRTIGVPMGTVTVDLALGEYVKAVQVTPAGSGNPGCSTVGTTLTYPQLTDAEAVLALPYGTWQLFEGPLPATAVVPVTAVQIVDTSNASGAGADLLGVVTIDPRGLK